jgi:hypothetical protein
MQVASSKLEEDGGVGACNQSTCRVLTDTYDSLATLQVVKARKQYNVTYPDLCE